MTDLCYHIVISKAGRDAGRRFLVLAQPDEKHVLLCDGALRKLERPKRKKRMHIQPFGRLPEETIQAVKGGLRFTDADVRKWLAETW